MHCDLGDNRAGIIDHWRPILLIGAQPSDFPAFCDINAPEVERFSVSSLAVAGEERRAVAEVCSLFPAARVAEAGRKRNKANKKGRCNDLLDSCS